MGDRGNWHAERILYRESFDLRSEENRVSRATVEYKVAVSFHAWESGNANWLDDRACHFDSMGRTLTRDIVLHVGDLPEHNLGSFLISLPDPSGKLMKNPCNDCLPDNMNAYLSENLGDANTWQAQIGEDRARVEEIVNLIGTITGRSASAV